MREGDRVRGRDSPELRRGANAGPESASQRGLSEQPLLRLRFRTNADGDLIEAALRRFLCSRSVDFQNSPTGEVISAQEHRQGPVDRH